MKKEDVKIIFMGTPEFAVPSLNMLYENGYNIVGVITAPDRPAGRGKKVVYSPVKEYALNHGLQLIQPTNLKDEAFLQKLSSLKADLQIVIAFRMLPKSVWNMPKFGTFNLHASLLPQYRGAAPINHALINGEKTTGLTTFFIDEKIDTGCIIKQVKMEIVEDETYGELHDRMKAKGVSLIKDTIDQIISDNGRARAIDQNKFINPDMPLMQAPKIFKEDCRINWAMPVDKINNLIRGLSPVPGAFSFLSTKSSPKVLVKIFKSTVELTNETDDIGKVITDQNSYLKVAASHGYLRIIELQMEGKRKMSIEDYLRGYQIQDGSFFL